MAPLRFFVNGSAHVLHNAPITQSLASYLRSDSVRLMGTKVGDGQGLTGFDTVVVIDISPERELRVRPLPASLVTLGMMHGKAVVTVEGLGNMAQMHPIQKQFTNCDASQCGFCLGGFVMSLYALLRNKPAPTCADIEEAFDGNFCRCTGYNPIAAAAAAFATDASADMLSRWEVEHQTFVPENEPDAPEVFSAAGFETAHEETSLTTGETVSRTTWHAPATLAELVAHVRRGACLVGGNTHRSVDGADSLVTTDAVQEMQVLEVCTDRVRIGAGRSISELAAALRREPTNKSFAALEHHLRFALSTQRRALATLGGELACPKAEADLAVGLAPLARVHCLVGDELVEAELTVDELSCNDVRVIVAIEVTASPDQPEPFFYRVARRRVSAEPMISLALVHDGRGHPSALYSAREIGSGVVVKADISGVSVASADGIAPAAETMTAAVSAQLAGPRSAYRRQLLLGALHKGAWAVAAAAGAALPEDVALSAPRTLGLPITHRTWSAPQTDMRAVGHPTKLKSAASKATGDAQYTIDASAPGMLHAAIVGAPEVGKRITGFNTSAALAVDGVVDFVSAADIPGANHHSGIPPQDTPVFQDKITQFEGEPLGLVVGKTVAAAREGARRVKVLLEDILDRDVTSTCPADITKGDLIPDIETAIARKSYHTNADEGAMVLLTEGDSPESIHAAIEAAPVRVQGKITFGGQDHTYAEVQNCLVEPLQDGCWKITTSCQNVSKAQHDVAAVLGIPASRVTASVWQLGGGYGGKQDRPVVFCTMAAVAANKTGRPVKLVLYRSEDMLISAGRHPFYYEYSFGATEEGKLIAGDALCVADGGSTTDVTPAVLNKAIFQSNGPYTIPHFRVEGRAAKTNRVTNTAYRGFGGPQGGFLIEAVLDHVQRVTGVSGSKIREVNINRAGDQNISGAFNEGTNFRTAQDQPLRCWKKLTTETDVLARETAAEEFNRGHRHVKRGVGFTNARNGVVFEEKFMIQAMANVHVLHDGTVMVSHSGTEMGQGLHEKVCQAVLEILPVTREMVRVLETSTDTCTNTQPTSASSGPDLNVPPVVDCCKQILARLQPRLDRGDDWVGAVIGAYFDATDLHATSYINGPPELQYHWDYYKPGPSRGATGLYCGYGAAGVEIELDVLTGEWQALRADLVKDAGRPLNPHADLGQVEGGFCQGFGLTTSEAVEWDGAHQTTDELSKYACPTIADVPRVVHSMLLEEAPNEIGFAFKSKACEETPTIFGTAAFMALKEAVAAARRDRGLTEAFIMNSPATRENILQLINAEN